MSEKARQQRLWRRAVRRMRPVPVSMGIMELTELTPALRQKFADLSEHGGAGTFTTLHAGGDPKAMELAIDGVSVSRRRHSRGFRRHLRRRKAALRH